MSTLLCRQSQVFQGPLVLIGRDHPLRAGAAGDLVPVDDDHPGVLLERQAARLLAACLRRAGGAGAIVPVSGWRSREEQQAIWDETLAAHGADFTRRYVAPPGCNEHQSGLAIDLGKAAPEIDLIRPDFPGDGVCGAFRRLAASYGFIERYRAGKEARTNIAPEPWHFRYVGAPHAHLLEVNGLCLEEYAAFLRESPRTCRLPGGTARVFYVPCRGAETAVDLPEGCCQVSGDNDGGFIVTAWGREP